MSEEKFQNRFRIPSSRASWHDYANGCYFVTICTHNKEYYFGDIVKDDTGVSEMDLSKIGQFAHDQIQNITKYYPYAEIPLWVVMPNHIHMIVIVDSHTIIHRGNGYGGGFCRGGCRDAINRVSTTNGNNRVHTGGVTKNKNPMTYQCLGAVIRGYKARVTRFANQNNITFAWQTRYYDQIIRNPIMKIRITKYIENNVAKWGSISLCK